MTGFDETVPPDPDPDRDATTAQNARDNDLEPRAGNTYNEPAETLDADEGEPDIEPFAGS